jgi:hypothetical protein
LTFLALLFVNGFVPLVGVWAASRHNVPPREAFFWPSVGFSFFMALELPLPGMRLAGFWISCGITAAVSAAALGLASWITPRIWQDRPAGGWWLRVRGRIQQWTYGAPAERRAFRTRLLDVNPMCWLAGRDRLRPAYVWIFLGACLAIWVWGGLKFGGDWLNPGTYVITAMLLNGALKIWIASAAAERFLEDQRENALELLLSTPLTTRELLHGQILALRRQFQGPLLAVVGVNWIFLLAPWWHAGWSDGAGPWVRMFACTILTLAADAWVLAWVGMWMGLTVRHANRAAAGAVLRVLVLPWIAFVLILMVTFLVANLGRLQGAGFEPTEDFMLGLGMLLSAGAEAGFGLWAWRHLHNDMRTVAARRYQPAAPGFLRQIFQWR